MLWDGLRRLRSERPTAHDFGDDRRHLGSWAAGPEQGQAIYGNLSMKAVADILERGKISEHIVVFGSQQEEEEDRRGTCVGILEGYRVSHGNVPRQLASSSAAATSPWRFAACVGGGWRIAEPSNSKGVVMDSSPWTWTKQTWKKLITPPSPFLTLWSDYVNITVTISVAKYLLSGTQVD